MTTFIAACGIDCEGCEARIATQKLDSVLAQAVAERWGRQFGLDKALPIEAVWCDGCLTEGARKGGYCGQCPIRACAVERKVENCAACDDYGCATLEAFLVRAAPLRERLEALRQGARG
jgi:hypothetical protein